MPIDIATQIIDALAEAGIPAADVEHNDDDAAEAFTVNTAGYYLTSTTARSATIVIMGRTSADAVTRLAERDGLAQQARAALDGAGLDATINLYGNITARTRQQTKGN
ncbi:hypothetical protein ACWGQT_00725 [Streptomyces yangpuensis]